MNKLFTLALVCLTLTLSQTSMAAISYPTEPANMVEIGYGVKIPASKMATLTPKEYMQLTGHRLGLFKSLALKSVQHKMKRGKFSEGKSQLTAVLLCFFLGGLGIHRFYLGYTWQGIVQLLTFGGFGIWVLIDFIRLIIGDLQPKNSEYAKTL